MHDARLLPAVPLPKLHPPQGLSRCPPVQSWHVRQWAQLKAGQKLLHQTDSRSDCMHLHIRAILHFRNCHSYMQRTTLQYHAPFQMRPLLMDLLLGPCINLSERCKVFCRHSTCTGTAPWFPFINLTCYFSFNPTQLLWAVSGLAFKMAGEPWLPHSWLLRFRLPLGTT